MAKGYLWCPHCKETKKTQGDFEIIYDGDTITKICNKSECREIERLDIEEKKAKLAEFNLNKAKKEGWETIQGMMKKGYKIEVDFESYDWLAEKEKEICRQYNKRCQNIEDLKKQKDQVKKEAEKAKRDALKCQKCQKIPNNGKYYEVGGEGNYCKGCAKEIVDSSNSNNSNSDKGQKERPVNKPPANAGSPCDECGLNFSTYYTIGGKGHYCDNCADKLISSRKNSNRNDSSSNNKNNPRKDKHYPKKLKPIADTLKTGKDLINQGYEYSDIDTSRLSESQRKKLEEYHNSKIMNGGDREKKHFLDTGPGLAVCIAGWIIVITGIISLIVWIVVRRRKKKIKK